MTTLCLKNCTLADGSQTDILIDNGLIKQLGVSLQANEIIDCTGKTVLPGIIDVHVHFRVPGAEHKEDWQTGSAAAAAGGVTSVIEMPNTDPATIDQQTLDDKKKIAARDSVINYGLYLGATTDNAAGIVSVQGAAGIKIFMGSSTGNLLVAKDEDISAALQAGCRLYAFHAEDEFLINAKRESTPDTNRPSIHSVLRGPEAAIRAVERIIALAAKFHARVHICHVNTAAEVELISQAKNEGVRITAEVSPHHLLLNESIYESMNNLAKVNPPLRTKRDNAALWQGLADGAIDIIATDHAPHLPSEKKQPYDQAPAGLPEVQTSLPLMLNAVHEGKTTLQQLQQFMAKRPAQLFGLIGKGKIAVGYDADLAIVDTKIRKKVSAHEMLSKCGWTPYDGWEVTGWPIMTLVNGNIVFKNNTIHKQYKGSELTYGTI